MNILIVGGGSDGAALLEMLQTHDLVHITGVVDTDDKSEIIKLARLLGIPTASDYGAFLDGRLDLIINVTGSSANHEELFTRSPDGCEVISGTAVKLLRELMSKRQRDRDQTETLLIEHRALYHIGLILSSTDDLSDVFKTIVEYATLLTNTPAGSLAVFNEKSGEMYLGAAKGFVADLSKQQRWKLRQGGLTSFILNQKDPVAIPDISEHPKVNNKKLASEGVHSLIACPLCVEGKIVGIIYVDDFEPRPWKEREISALSLLSTYAAVAIERAKLLEETRLLAITDDLTSMYNHRYFVQRLSHEVNRAERYEQPLSLIMLDIDYFKNYNDRHGHIKGNEILKRVAHVIMRESREADIPVRYGGEEFAVILPQTTKKDAISLAERLREEIEKEDFPLSQTQPGGRLTISLGIATYPTDASSPTELVEIADVALYQAKRLGKNRVCSYKSEPAPCA
ncbi:MAG: diguanylate cyclase [Actinobacteria bacterium]|nr:diguanylate cyclase [Actinomycetota bacterium]